MASSRTSKRTTSSSEDTSLSDCSSGREEEKTIPFLRRLRDMLVENEDVISFSPGSTIGNRTVLGRIVVHDRVQVEQSVLPRYFNHSSFASLRRQLNYFSFVRLGKGRQRESTYVNEHVIALDDILNLKRRPAGHAPPLSHEDGNNLVVIAVTKDGSVVELTSATTKRKSNVLEKGAGAPSLVSLQAVPAPRSKEEGSTRPKRRRITSAGRSKPKRMAATTSTATSDRGSPTNNFVSEDENSEERQQPVALDLTKPPTTPDDDVLAGCNALLELAFYGWD